MTDPLMDESGAINDRDLIGSDAAPAGLRAVDSQFLYVRMRVDKQPQLGTARAWGLLVDVDGNALTYEVMLAADGGAQTVTIYGNTASIPGDARDPPDATGFVEHAWAERARYVVASGSSYGGDSDYFVDLAYSWSELGQFGITATTPIRVWAATSSSATNGMTGDFACWNGGGGVALNESWPQTVADPGLIRLAGGGGCHHGQAGWAVLAGVALVLAWARRRTSRSA